jgi:YjbR
MNKHPDVPEKILDKLRLVCLDLPEAYEEQAWTGTRWMVRKKNFAHVLMIDQGWPPAYARAAGSDGPVCVLTFRSAAAELDASALSRAPFFRPNWWPNIAGVALKEPTDWNAIEKLLVASYRLLAPKKLADLVG